MSKSIRWRLGVVGAIAIGLAACNGSSTTMPASSMSAGAPVTTQDQPLTNRVPPMANLVAPDTLHGLSPVVAAQGSVNGMPGMFTPKYGDMADGGQGKPVDHDRCAPSMPQNKYHVHIFLGIVYRGKEIALPYAIGMLNSQPPVNGFVNYADCFYHMHTHDSSGIVHLEVDKSLPDTTIGVYTLKHFLDIWGIKRSTTRFGPFKGPVHIVIGHQTPLGGPTQPVSNYAAYTGDIDAIKLESHEVIWVEIGKRYYSAAQLPTVTFYTEW